MTEEKKKKKTNGCLTTILKLIFIIITPVIILGIVAYKEFVNSNKISATKSSYSNTIEIIKTEIAKCKSGEAKFMGSNEDCPVTGTKVINGMLVLSQEYPKNPFDDFKKAIRNSDSNNDDKDLGYINISKTEAAIIIKTCFKKPCNNKENQIQESIKIN
ncbi:hypothetical protein OAT07_05000 [Candidatus Pelagibacter sp.]|nr:hypothetical protein [Candidatus Pelagibacter sp.]